jgi:molybdopterin/thiamine biosynthesis adenylyltransferase
VEAYRLNPFASVAETDDGFLIHGTEALQVRFAKRDKAFVDLLMSGEAVPLSQLSRYLAQTRIVELQQKRVLLQGNIPPTEGRYSRQLGFLSLITPDFETCQAKLQAANVLLLGAGGIGSHVLWNLAAIGVRKITIVDFDEVAESNLNRQLMYSPEDIGQPKVGVLCARILKFNPNVQLVPVAEKIQSAADIEKFMAGTTLVVKAIDTPEQATAWVNELCVKYRIPFVAGGFLEYVGVVGPIYVPGKSVCAACTGLRHMKRLAGTGPTFAPLTGAVSAMIAMVASKIIMGLTDTLTNKVYTFNALTDSWDSMALRPAQACGVCGLKSEAPKESGQDTTATRVWAYRGAIALVALIGSLLRVIRHDQFYGLLVLIVFLLSIPVIELIFPDRPAETRRQMFAVCCIYSLSGLLVTVVVNLRTLSTVSANGFDRLFNLAQQVCIAMIAAVLGIALLFFALNALMYALKVAMRQKEKWIR